MTQHVWIVEMKERGRWLPTTGCSLNLRDARFDIREWRDANPDDRFRIVKYEARHAD